MEIERPFKFNLNSALQLFQFLGLIGMFAIWWTNSYADYRRDAETIASLKLQVADLQKNDVSLGEKLATSQFATATKLVGLERDVDYIKKSVERIERTLAPAK